MHHLHQVVPCLIYQDTENALVFSISSATGKSPIFIFKEGLQPFTFSKRTRIDFDFLPTFFSIYQISYNLVQVPDSNLKVFDTLPIFQPYKYI